MLGFSSVINSQEWIEKTEKTLREVKIWSKLNNENIVDFHSAWFEYKKSKFNYSWHLNLHIQMENCNFNLRKTLKIINEELSKSSQQVLCPLGAFIRSQFLLQIFKGMSYLHSKDIPIIHRDLKLSNIVVKIDHKGVFVKICDFGLSTNHERKLENGELISQSHSQNTGTLGYMAPEVERGRKYNEKSDVHCIGSIIIKMFDIHIIGSVQFYTKYFIDKLNTFFYSQNKLLPFEKYLIPAIQSENQEVIKILDKKLSFMLSFAIQLLDSEPRKRKPAHEILSLSEYWCISCKDIMADQIVLRILNQWTPYKSTKTKLLHVNIIHGFFKHILYREYYFSQTFPDRFSEQYPQLFSLNNAFKSRIDSIYIFREMVDKLFFITKDDEVFEVTMSEHIDETKQQLDKLSEICYAGICDITCGERHVIARTKSGLLFSWGDNCCGQLGDGTIINRNKPKVINSLQHLNIITVSCGAYHTLALTSDGELYGWGYNRIGQVGNGQNRTNEWSPFKIEHPPATKFEMISCGYHHSLALSSDRKVYSWGYNEYGQLGIGRNSNQDIPQLVVTLNNIAISKIVCGRYHSLFLTLDGDIYGCGRNSTGQIGNETQYNSNIPIKMSGCDKFKDVTASIFDNISLAESTLNEFYICGESIDVNLLTLTKTQYKSYHELKMIMSISRRTSQPLRYNEFQNEHSDKFAILGSDILNQISSQVHLATVHSYMETKSLIITDSNEIYCMNLMKELNEEDNPKKVQEFSQSTLISISSGVTHNLALTANGKILSWGYNNKGQLGYSSKNGQYKPKIINSIDTFIKISCGAYHSLALSESGDVYSWGHNYRGELGNNSNSDELTPYRIAKLRCLKIVDISCGYNHSIAVSKKGRCYSWGNNEFGQLGIGNNANALEPSEIIFPANTSIIKVRCGTSHSLFLTSDGRIFACGLNHFGQIGNGTEDNQNFPVHLPCGISFIDLHATIFDHISVARSVNGECYMWGECGGEAKLKPEKTGYRSMYEVFSIYSKSKHDYKLIPFKFIL